MKPGILFFDCAGTLLHPSEPIGEVYARQAAAFGMPRDPARIEAAFRSAWRGAGRPVYPDGPDEKPDRAWWREIVRQSLNPSPDPPPPSGSHSRLSSALEKIRETAPEIEAEAFEACFISLFEHYARPSAWSLFPDVLPALNALRGKVRLGVLSNFDARLHPLLKGHGLTEFFDPVVISSESAACKPDRAIFARASSLAGLPPEACLLAGDDPVNDWRGAEEAGWQVFRLRRPEHSLSELPAAIAD